MVKSRTNEESRGSCRRAQHLEKYVASMDEQKPRAHKRTSRKYRSSQGTRNRAKRDAPVASREKTYPCEYTRGVSDCKKGGAHLQQTKALRFQFVESHRSEFSLEKMCAILDVSRSEYYKWRLDRTSQHHMRKAQVMKRIRHQKRCGCPNITYLLHLERY